MRLISVIFLLVGSLVPPSVFAKCGKEDVDFYLEKGFTPEQITQLCATSDADVPDYKPYQQQVIIYSNEEGPGVKDGFTREERQAIKDLQQGVDVVGLVVDQDSIQYTVKVCLAVQEGKDYNQRFKTCPEVFYRVARAGLTVAASGKRLLFLGQQTIQVKGNIKRQSKVNFDDYPTQFKKQLKRAFDWKSGKNTAQVPVRGDYSVTKIVNALNALAKEPDPNTVLAQNEEDVVDVTAEDEDQPEKKKRWWNPFD